MNEKGFIKAMKAFYALYLSIDMAGTGASEKKMDWRAFSSLIEMLFDEGAEKALEWVEEQTAGAALEDEIPFAGWIMLVINIATTLAQLAETIVEVATSPWMITNKIATAITSTLT